MKTNQRLSRNVRVVEKLIQVRVVAVPKQHLDLTLRENDRMLADLELTVFVLNGDILPTNKVFELVVVFENFVRDRLPRACNNSLVFVRTDCWCVREAKADSVLVAL